MNQIILEKVIFTSIKGQLYFTKGYIKNPDRPVEAGRIPPNQRFFLTCLIQIVKNKASNPWMLYLSKVDPVDCGRKWMSISMLEKPKRFRLTGLITLVLLMSKSIGLIFPLRLLCISINIPYNDVWNTAIMSATWNC